jgi:hypothetical protein
VRDWLDFKIRNNKPCPLLKLSEENVKKNRAENPAFLKGLVKCFLQGLKDLIGIFGGRGSVFWLGGQI